MASVLGEPAPVLARFVPFQGWVPKGMVTDFLGTLTRVSFYCAQDDQAGPPEYQQTLEPPVTEEYFEYLDLLEAVCLAEDSFTMMELGAGFGRWMVRAAAAARQCGAPALHLIGVEADPVHFDWMGLHFQDNGLNPAEHRLIQAAVAERDGQVSFSTGDSRLWYGQAIISESIGRNEGRRVPAVSLKTLLKDLQRVDFLDLDVQGSEYRVLYPAARRLDLQVKRVHIGTHHRAVEAGVRDLFKRLGWICRWDFPGQTSNLTPYGQVYFGDGVQSWINPRWNYDLAPS